MAMAVALFLVPSLSLSLSLSLPVQTESLLSTGSSDVKRGQTFEGKAEAEDSSPSP